MKQTIEIEVPEGKKAVWKDNKVVFEDITHKMPKTWEEFCETVPTTPYNDSYIQLDSTISTYTTSINIYRREGNDRNLLPSKEAAEAHLALMQLHQLRDCYRQGWTPKDRSKHFGIVRTINGECDITEYIGLTGFLSFETRELAEDFLYNFKDLIKKAGDLI